MYLIKLIFCQYNIIPILKTAEMLSMTDHETDPTCNPVDPYVRPRVSYRPMLFTD